MAINPIIYGGICGKPILIGGQAPYFNRQGQLDAIGGQPIHRGMNGRPISIGGKPVHYPRGTSTSSEVGGLPVLRDLSGGPSAVVGPTINPIPLPPKHATVDTPLSIFGLRMNRPPSK